MSKSNAWETDILGLLFNATAVANVADNAGASPLTNLFVSLHVTPGPGEAGDQLTNEVGYTGYVRATVARTSGGWTVSGNSVSPTSDIEFPACTGGTATATHAAIGAAVSGGSKIFYYGALSPVIAISDGVTPRITAGSTITED